MWKTRTESKKEESKGENGQICGRGEVDWIKKKRYCTYVPDEEGLERRGKGTAGPDPWWI
jgi:hypothetical protein